MAAFGKPGMKSVGSSGARSLALGRRRTVLGGGVALSTVGGTRTSGFQAGGVNCVGTVRHPPSIADRLRIGTTLESSGAFLSSLAKRRSAACSRSSTVRRAVAYSSSVTEKP